MASDLCVSSVSIVLLSALFKVYPGDAYVLSTPVNTRMHSVGETVVLQCTCAQNIPLTWTFTPLQGEVLHSNSRILSAFRPTSRPLVTASNSELYSNNSVMLIITDVQVNDAGVYECVDVDTNPANVVKSVQLIVIEVESTTKTNGCVLSTASYSTKLLALLENRFTQAPGIVFLVTVVFGATLLSVIIYICCKARFWRRPQKELQQSDEQCSACEECESLDPVENLYCDKRDSWRVKMLTSREHLLHV